MQPVLTARQWEAPTSSMLAGFIGFAIRVDHRQPGIMSLHEQWPNAPEEAIRLTKPDRP